MTARDLVRLRAQLQLHEGVRSKPYVDTVGKITIGVGRNLTDRGLTPDEIQYLLEHDIAIATGECAQWPWFATLDGIRQRVLIDLAFNLGHRLLEFHTLLGCLARGEYAGAAEALLHSKYATQVGGRAIRLAGMLASGEDYTT